MESEDNENKQLTKLEKFSKGFASVMAVAMPVGGLILLIFNFGWGIRSTEASTKKDIEDLKAGQETVKTQIISARSERISNNDEMKKEFKSEFEKLRTEIKDDNSTEREDRKRLEDKVDKLIERQLR